MYDVYSVVLYHPMSSGLLEPTVLWSSGPVLFALFAMFALVALACVIVVPLPERVTCYETSLGINLVNSAIELSKASCMMIMYSQYDCSQVSALDSQNAIVPKDNPSIPSVSVPCQGHSYPQEAPVP